MHWNQVSRWLFVPLLVGCNAKLQLDAMSAGAAGNAETGGTDAGGGGEGGIAGDSAVDTPVSGGFTSAAGAVGAAGGGAAGAGAAGAVGAAGAGGGPVIGPVPGQRGQNCIPGGTNTEAAGSPAKATIVTLDRCNDGLACDTTKHCSSIPNCPQASGVCVVYGTPVVQDTGTGGTGGTSGGDNGLAGGSGITLVESGIVRLAADDTHLYWVEYGTRDNLGNYQHDGALRAYDIASAKATTLAADLPGPVALGITSGHAYVGVDGGSLIGAPTHPQLLRLPLSGGATEVVQEAEVGGLTAAGDQAYWTTSSGPGKPSSSIYTVAPSGAGTPTQVRDSSYTLYLQADDTDLYFVGPYGGKSVIVRQSQTGGSSAATQVVPQPYVFGLSADSIYGVEDGMVLDQVPKSGGEWTRQRGLGAGGNPELVQILGDRYFVAAHSAYLPGSNNTGAEAMVLTGLLSSSAPPLRLVEISATPQPNWQITANAVFWTDGNAIFSRPVTDQ